jgi:hypothetical protein
MGSDVIFGEVEEFVPEYFAAISSGAKPGEYVYIGKFKWLNSNTGASTDKYT